jgi:hypothetical protein
MDAQPTIAELNNALHTMLDENESLRAELAKVRAQYDIAVAENERLRADADAHSVLRLIYSDPRVPETTRIKAASSAIAFEKPKLSSVTYHGQYDRRVLWQTYECFALKREIVRTTGTIPPRGYADHLLGDDYQPPPGKHLPPLLVVPDPASRYRVLADQSMAGRDEGEDENANPEPSAGDREHRSDDA